MAVMDRSVSMSGAMDDLPRTLRREREARDRAQKPGQSHMGLAPPNYAPSASTSFVL